MGELLKKYYRKIVVESLIKSAVFGLIIGGSMSFIVATISLITKYDHVLWLSLGLGFAATAISMALLYFFAFKPTMQKAAARVDSLGLEERTITMLEFEGDDSYIAELQRNDAKEVLKSVDTKEIKFTFLKFPIAVMIGIAILATSMMAISTIEVDKANAEEQKRIEEQNKEPELSKEDQTIKKLVDNLREIINNAEIDIQLKNTLHAKVDEMVSRLATYNTLAEKIEVIRQTRDEIYKIIEDALHKTYGDALMIVDEEDGEQDTTYVLGEALNTLDETKVAEAFDMMYDRVVELELAEMIDQMNKNADDIEAAIEIATEDNEPMKVALQALADAFRRAAEELETEPEEQEPTEEEQQEAMEELQEAMDAAQEAMQEAMQGMTPAEQEENEAMEEMEGQMGEEFSEAMEELGEQEEEEEQDQEQPGNENTELLPTEPQPEVNPPTDYDGEMSREQIIDGETPYTDSLPQATQDALNDIENGAYSDKNSEMIAEYIDTVTPRTNP